MLSSLKPREFYDFKRFLDMPGSIQAIGQRATTGRKQQDSSHSHRWQNSSQPLFPNIHLSFATSPRSSQCQQRRLLWRLFRSLTRKVEFLAAFFSMSLLSPFCFVMFFVSRSGLHNPWRLSSLDDNEGREASRKRDWQYAAGGTMMFMKIMVNFIAKHI